MTSATTTATTPSRIDPRGPRFAAGVTAVILAAVLILGPSAGLPLLVVQLLAFAAGAVFGLKYQPWGVAFRYLVRPRLQPPSELEDEAPPRFAQFVGLLFAVVALLGAVLGSPVVFYVAVGFALAAALLNAVFDFCLGCEMFLLGRRLLAGSRPAKS